MFLPYILAPTRITDHKVSTLDHIFARLPIKNLDYDIYSGNIFADITDHLPNFISIYKTHSRNYTKDRPLVRIFSETNIENFKTAISNIDWESTLNTTDTNEAYDVFYNKLFDRVTTFFIDTKISKIGLSISVKRGKRRNTIS